MLTRMDSQELSGWQAFFIVRGEERQAEIDRAESGDGQVVYYGREDDDELSDETE